MAPGFAATCEGMPLPPEAGGTVKGLQHFLNVRGLGPLAEDGVCGFATFNAWQKYNMAKAQMGTVQTQPATMPSGPSVRPKLEIVPVPPPPLPVPPPAAKPPLWKRPEVIGGAAVVLLLLWLMRRK